MKRREEGGRVDDDNKDKDESNADKDASQQREGSIAATTHGSGKSTPNDGPFGRDAGRSLLPLIRNWDRSDGFFYRRGLAPSL